MPTRARVRAFLESVAKRQIPITCPELAKPLQILLPRSIHRVTEALERLMGEDPAAGRPFIAALVISKARGGLPALRFFECARRLGRFAGDPDGQDAWSFHAAELNAVFAHWGFMATRRVRGWPNSIGAARAMAAKSHTPRGVLHARDAQI